MNELVPLYRAMAADGANFRGLSILQHRSQIAKICKEHGAKRLLDYGSGAGDAWKQPHRMHRDLGLRWFDVTLYDPAFPEHDDEPHGMFDGVLCSDVLEHIPEEDLETVVAQLFTHARHFVWASVCCRPAKKSFPDGTNLHVTLHPLEWWQELFEAHKPRDREVVFVLVETP